VCACERVRVSAPVDGICNERRATRMTKERETERLALLPPRPSVAGRLSAFFSRTLPGRASLAVSPLSNRGVF
jgi:hypothetical protein